MSASLVGVPGGSAQIQMYMSWFCSVYCNNKGSECDRISNEIFVKVNEKCFQYPDVYSLLRWSTSNPLQPNLHDQYNEFQQDNIEPYPSLRIYLSRSSSCQRLSNHGHHNRETSGN